MSANDLIRLFTRLANQSEVWNALSFHTHGSGGSIGLGSTSLNLDSIQRLENQGFDRIFAADCTITFDGCSLKGGKVRGNTGIGFGYWGTEESVHPFGSWITVTVGQGGTFRFDKLIHMHPDRINQRIAPSGL